MSGDFDTIDSKLSGESLGERHRSLNQLIREASPESLSAEAVGCWAQSSQAHQIYIARLADHFKNAALLCELLCSENEMVVSVALHATWFFRGLTDRNLCNADYFITQIFPRASYHSICRIISALSVNLQDETVAEDFYTKISETYGNNLANRLLRVCGVDFIRSKITEDNFYVPPLQLLYIYKKYPRITLTYLTRFLQENGNRKLYYRHPCSRKSYDNVWSLVAQNHPEFYVSSFEKYPDYMDKKLGARLTKSILMITFDKVLQEPLKYIPILHGPTLFFKLKGENLNKFIMNILPTNVKELYFYKIASIIKFSKFPFQAQLLFDIYPQKYQGASVMGRDDLLSWGYIECLPADIRNTWALNKIEKVQPSDYHKEDFYLKYMTADTAIPRLKTIYLKAFNESDKLKLLSSMLECCQTNNDLNTLLDFLKYFSVAHKNESYKIRHHLIESLSKVFELHQLTFEHWEIINEMIDFMCTSREIETNYSHQFLTKIFEEFIKFCYLNNRDIGPGVDKLIEYGVFQLRLFADNLKLRTIVQDMIFSKYKDKLDKVSNNLRTYMISQLLEACLKKENAKIWITKYSWFYDLIKKVITGRDEHDTFKYLLRFLYRDPYTLRMFSNELYKHNTDKKFANHVIKHNTNVISNNLDLFLERSMTEDDLKSYVKVFHKIRAYFMKPLGECLLEKINVIQDTKNPSKNALRVITLSLLHGSDKGEELIKELAPTKAKVNLKLHAKEYAMGKILSNHLRYINPPISYETLLLFARGDYLKFSLFSMLHLSFKKSLKDTETFIIKLSKKPVSVKKHSVRLAYFIFPQDKALRLYEKMWKIESNSSIRDVLFQRTFSLMIQEKDIKKYDRIWSNVKKFMGTFTAIDVNLFQYLDKASEIPNERISDYYETSWKTFKMLSSQNLDVDNQMYYFTESFSKYKTYFSEKFCESIIKEYFDMIDENVQYSNNLLSFLVDYIMSTKQVDQQSEQVESTCKVFTKFISENWNLKDKNSFRHRKTVKNFIVSCCARSLVTKMEINPINLLKTIRSMIINALPLGTLFELHIVLNLTISYLELIQKPNFIGLPQQWNGDISPNSFKLLKEFGQIVGVYLNSMSDMYGIDILSIFTNAYNKFMGYFRIPGENKNIIDLHLISGLIEGKTTRQCFVMAAKLIPSPVLRGWEHEEFYKNIVSRIASEGDIVVRFILNNKIEQVDDLLC